MGGIGQSVCLWMTKHSAKNLVILSRNSNMQAESDGLLSNIPDAGCSVDVFACDVASMVELTKALPQRGKGQTIDPRSNPSCYGSSGTHI
jgi:hypothetical protein